MIFRKLTYMVTLLKLCCFVEIFACTAGKTLLQFIGNLFRFCLWIQYSWKALQQHIFFFCFVLLGGRDTVEFPIKFTPKKPGCYHCQIILKSSCDIRVYEIECVVNAEQADAQLEFLTPAYQTVTQEIPIVSSFLYC